jgi:hypothetical protein
MIEVERTKTLIFMAFIHFGDMGHTRLRLTLQKLNATSVEIEAKVNYVKQLYRSYIHVNSRKPI